MSLGRRPMLWKTPEIRPKSATSAPPKATSLKSQWPLPADVISLLNVVAKAENCHPHRCRVLRSMPRQEKDSDSGIRKQSPRVRVCVSRAGLPAVAGLHAGLESPSQAIRGGDYRVLWRLFR